MNQYLSSASLKSLAKGQLLGNYGTVIGATVLQALCTVPISIIISLVIGTNGVINILVYSLAIFLLALFTGYFEAGQTYIHLKVACCQPILISDLFHFFRQDASKLIYIQAVLSGISTICSLPLLIVGYYLNQNMGIVGMSLSQSLTGFTSNALSADSLPVNEYLLLLYAVLFVAGNIIEIYLCDLVFSQVFYLLLDFPEYSAPQMLKMSVQLMKGSKGRLFYLSLSFIPLIFLGFFSCGIALLWIKPYMRTTYANFYLDLVKKRNPD